MQRMRSETLNKTALKHVDKSVLGIRYELLRLIGIEWEAMNWLRIANLCFGFKWIEIYVI